MRTPELLSVVIFCLPLLACGSKFDAQDGKCDGTSLPATTTTPDCPAAADFGTCTQEGQTCTWTTGQSSATYTCVKMTECNGIDYVEWTNPVLKGDGCDGSACCVPCAEAQESDPCDALGFQCPHPDNSVFPPVSGLLCQDHKWTEILVCEN
jgi:hypothetical protein